MKNQQHITACMRFRKNDAFNNYGMSFLLHPYFCPFLLLKYNKEAGKNIAYTRNVI